MIVFELFLSFVQIGMLGFGGGQAMIPLIQQQVVDQHGWLTTNQFLDGYAFGNALPGPIATKMAAYTGYKVAGWLGATVSTLGITLPSILGMILLATLYLKYKDTPYVNHFLSGVRPVVVALLVLVVYEFTPKTFGQPATWLIHWPLWAIAGVAFALTAFFNVHPVWVILAGGLLGLVIR